MPENRLPDIQLSYLDAVEVLKVRQGKLVERELVAFVIEADGKPKCCRRLQRQAVQHLAALGHLRIAFVSGPEHLKTVVQRKAAFLECMREIGLPTSPQLLIDGDHTMAAGMTAISALAALPDRPSAVVCSNDLTAIGLMRQAFELALEIPRDLSVVGFDDIRPAQFMIPPLTTIQLSQIEIADLAFRALLDSAEAPCNRSSCYEYTIKTNLVLRRSTALAPDGFGRVVASLRIYGIPRGRKDRLTRRERSVLPTKNSTIAAAFTMTGCPIVACAGLLEKKLDNAWGSGTRMLELRYSYR